MRKGFTLIELLAVIVILAIISAIAIPIVIKVIDDVKINSLKISMSNIEKAVNLYINKESINENKTITCSNGVCIDELNNKLELTGNIIDSGTINITPAGTITYNKLIIDGFLCDKYNKEFVCHKTSKNIEEPKEESIIIKNTSNSLSNYKIYGNSVQDGTPIEIESFGERTKNLISINNYDLTGSTLDKVIFDGNLSLPATFSWDIDYTPNNQAALFSFVVDGTTKYVTAITKKFLLKGTTLTQIKILNWSQDVGKVTNIQLEEGTEATDYEPYGKFKIPVKVSGNNIINPAKWILCENSNGFKITTTDTITTFGENYVETTIPAWKGMASDIFEIEKFNSFGFKINKNSIIDDYETYYVIIQYYDENQNKLPNKILSKDVIADTEYIITKNSFTIPTGTKYFRVGIVVRGQKIENLKIYDMYMNEDNSTDYEPYIELITNIYLDEPLRKIGNYVDYIDYKNQKLIKNVGVLNLNSEDNFKLIDNYFVLSLENYPKNDKELSMSNYLEYGSSFLFDGDELKLRIEGINTIEELKTWLSDKKVEIYYPLNKSIVSSVELPEISLNKNYSDITIDTTIKPSNILIEYN